eukprot:SAG11_NODE_3533_length_2385_cov_37.379537_3_plen_168_part_01
MLAELNALCADINLTFDISTSRAIFLDLILFKGVRHAAQQLLDTTTYQKPVNRYLYTPPSSEHPTHCAIGLVHSELRRHIKRNTARASYIKHAQAFARRLQLRGFSFSFLARCCRTAPRFEDRCKFLSPPAPDADTSPVIAFSTTFHRQLLNSRLSRAIFLHRDLLPA